MSCFGCSGNRLGGGKIIQSDTSIIEGPSSGPSDGSQDIGPGRTLNTTLANGSAPKMSSSSSTSSAKTVSRDSVVSFLGTDNLDLRQVLLGALLMLAIMGVARVL